MNEGGTPLRVMPITPPYEWKYGRPTNVLLVPIYYHAPMEMFDVHAYQADKNHGQTPARLAERGGISACEALAILQDRPNRPMPNAVAYRQLADLIHAHENRTVIATVRIIDLIAARAVLDNLAKGTPLEGRFARALVATQVPGTNWEDRANKLEELLKNWIVADDKLATDGTTVPLRAVADEIEACCEAARDYLYPADQIGAAYADQGKA